MKKSPSIVEKEVEGIQARFKLDNWHDYNKFIHNDVSNEWENIVAVLQELNEEDVFYDIGANVGGFSCFTSQKVATVCIEPLKQNYRKLKENHRINDLELSGINAAVSNYNGEAYLEGPDLQPGQGRVKLSGEGEKTQVYRLDQIIEDFDLPAPSVLKIDVEGEELRVLQGLGKYIDNVRTLFLELHEDSDYSYAEITEFLNKKGFGIDKSCSKEEDLTIKASRELSTNKKYFLKNTAVLTKNLDGKGGVPGFEKNLLEKLYLNEVKKDFEGRLPFSEDLKNILFSKQVKNSLEEYDKVLIPSQSRVDFNPDSIDTEVIPYIHDLIPVTHCFKKYDNTLRGRLSGYPSSLLGTRYTKFIANCNEAICASETTKQELLNRTSFNGKAHVVYQGVDNLPEIDKDLDRDIDLLYVGGLLERKNPWLLEKCLEEAVNQGFTVAHVTNDPSLPGKHFGDISDSHLAHLYRRSRYYLHPSLAEGFGRCPVEAQRYGSIPLALEIPINQEIIGEKEEAWKEITNAADVLEHLEKEVGTEEKENARKNAQRFKWSETAKQIAEILGQEKPGPEPDRVEE